MYSINQKVTLECSREGYTALRSALGRYIQYVQHDTAKDELMDDDFDFIREFYCEMV